MISLHHTHLMATDIDATITFWRDAFDAEVMYDTEFAGARNVFLRIGTGRIHLYDQPPKVVGQGTVHHVGIQTDQLEHLVAHLRTLEVSVTDISRRCGITFTFGGLHVDTGARMLDAGGRPLAGLFAASGSGSTVHTATRCPQEMGCARRASAASHRRRAARDRTVPATG